MPVRARIRTFAAIVATLSSAGAASAQTDKVIYFTDFQQGAPGDMWTNVTLTSSAAFSRFLGRFGNQTVSLTMPVNSERRHQLSFNFYAIDSWDGSSSPWGPDWFGVRLNGADLFRETFSNWEGGAQSYQGEALSSGANLDFGPYADSVWTLTMEFTPIVNQITLQFYAQGLEQISNESWGIDNVVIRELQEIPAPGPAALIGAALATALGRRRR